jgi:hypothetical protein
MEFFRRNRLLSFSLFLVLFILLLGKVFWPEYLSAKEYVQKQLAQVTQSNTASSQPTTTGTDLKSEIEFFLNQKGAAAYLLWQYSGEQSDPYGTDEHSFFKGSPICATLKEQAAKLPADKHLGVNIYNLAKRPEKLNDTLSYLKNECGTTVIRIWGNENVGGPAAVKQVLDAAQSQGIKVIVVAIDLFQEIGPDKANPGNWFKTNYRSTYRPYVQDLSSQIKNHPALYAIELANEPHCAGNTSCLSPFYSWAKDVSGLIRGSAPFISLGQIVQSTANTGDNPTNSEFRSANGAEGITATSGHYYKKSDREILAQAADQSKELGKTFYIGEASPNIKDDAVPEENYFEYNIQRADTTSVLNNFYDEYSVSCMPKQEYEVAINNRENCNQVENPKCQNWNVTGSLEINANGKLFGLFRDERKVSERIASDQAPTNRLESLEAYLSVFRPSGAPNDTQNNRDNSPYQAPIYKLTSLEEQCGAVINKLSAVEELCKEENRIEGDVADLQKRLQGKNVPVCSIDQETAGANSPTHTQLLSKYRSSGRTCKEIVNADAGDTALAQLRDEILATNIAMENAYRPAFLLAVTRFDGLKQKNQPTTNVTTTAQGADAEPDNFYVLDYLEVKVPAFASDFINPKSNRSNPSKNNAARDSYRDPLRLTADALLSLEEQKAFQKKEDEEREAVRKAGQPQPKYYGEIVGKNGEPIFCYKNGQLVACSPESGNTEGKADAVPAALLAFVNASAAKPNSILPCEGNEKDFYNPENKKKIAETVAQIGSSLEATDKTGVFTKKKSLEVKLSTTIKDIRDPVNIGTHTQVYFVSPHNYNLQYAQSAFLSLVSLEQQKQLKNMGLSTGGAALDPEKFSPLLKTELNDKVTGAETQRGGQRAGKPAPTTTDTTDDTTKKPNSEFFITSAKIDSLKENNAPKKHPLLWDLGGQVANLPTRLFTLLVTPTTSKLHQYTRSCTDQDLEHATENWFLGKCQPTAANVTPTTSCAPSDAITTCTNFGPSCGGFSTGMNEGGADASLSNGAIALAVEVSKYTCTPPEIIVGILAKESRGRTFVDGKDVPDSGDPNEIITREVACNALDLNNKDAAIYYHSCGAFQFAEFALTEQLRVYGGKDSSIQDCIDNVQVTLANGTKKLNGSDLDTRKLGVSMCVASAKMWHSLYCADGSKQCIQNQREYQANSYGCSGADRRSHSLSDYSEAEIRFSAGGFHGAQDLAVNNYWGYIQQYKGQVDKVKTELSACKKSE